MVITLVAARLQSRRDVGLGVWPARLGRDTNPRMRSSLALAARLQRGSLIGWSIGFLALGIMTGAMANDTGTLIAGNEKLIQIMHDIGGPGAMTDVLLASMGSIGGLLAAAYGIAAVLRLASEESAERAAPVLATAVDRRTYMAGHLAFAVVGSAWLLLLDGVATGLLFGASTGDLGAAMADGLSSTMVQLPAVLVLVGVAAALHGSLPRLTVLAWAGLGASLLLGQLGALLRLPRSVMDVSPFAHVPQVPSVPMAWTPMVALAAVAAVLIATGLIGFRRRDLRSA